MGPIERHEEVLPGKGWHEETSQYNMALTLRPRMGPWQAILEPKLLGLMEFGCWLMLAKVSQWGFMISECWFNNLQQGRPDASLSLTSTSLSCGHATIEFRPSKAAQWAGSRSKGRAPQGGPCLLSQADWHPGHPLLWTARAWTLQKMCPELLLFCAAKADQPPFRSKTSPVRFQPNYWTPGRKSAA